MAAVKRAGIIFDFDDTLVYSHQLFQLAEQEFAARMATLGLYDEELLEQARMRDIANVQAAGYLAVECFPQALAQTYDSYCAKYGHAADNAERQRLIELGRQAYLTRPREVAGARDLLRELRSGRYGDFRLLLFTQGEEQLQRQRIELCGFSEFFDTVRIVRVKDDAALAALLAGQNLSVAESWYVGNSLRADINPALRLGLKAVHLATSGWSYEQEQPCGDYHVISELAQFTDLLRQREQKMEAAR